MVFLTKQVNTAFKKKCFKCEGKQYQENKSICKMVLYISQYSSMAMCQTNVRNSSAN